MGDLIWNYNNGYLFHLYNITARVLRQGSPSRVELTPAQLRAGIRYYYLVIFFVSTINSVETEACSWHGYRTHQTSIGMVFFIIF